MHEYEAMWLEQALKGNSEAFSCLVDLYQRPVYNLCYRMLQNSEDAEDAEQETFMRAYKSMKVYDEQRSFATWLLSIAAHYCIDQIRKRKLNLVSIEDEPFLEIKDGQPDPEKMLSNKENEKQVRNLLEKLGSVDRAVVIMYYWYEYSYDEIAKALSLSLSAVKSRLHRARKDLAKEWMTEQSTVIKVERRSHESPAY